MSEYLLGIDNGGTVTKVVLFDLAGHAIRTASRKAAAQLPYPGWAERDMHSLWNSNADAIREVITASGIRPQQILGVGLTAHGNGLYLLDRRGKPLRPGILSVDNPQRSATSGSKMARTAPFAPPHCNNYGPVNLARCCAGSSCTNPKSTPKLERCCPVRITFATA